MDLPYLLDSKCRVIPRLGILQINFTMTCKPSSINKLNISGDGKVERIVRWVEDLVIIGSI